MQNLDYAKELASLGKWQPHSPEQIAAMRRHVAGQPDADQLLEILGIEP